MTDLYLPPLDELRPEIGAGDPLPSGPFAVSLTRDPKGWSEPFTVRSVTTNQAIAGHCGSRVCADAIVAGLNLSSEEKQMKRRKRTTKPTPAQTAMLRRISSGKLLVTMKNGTPHFTYDDGRECNQDSADILIRRGWVKPESPALLGELAQSYVVPR